MSERDERSELIARLRGEDPPAVDEAAVEATVAETEQLDEEGRRDWYAYWLGVERDEQRTDTTRLHASKALQAYEERRRVLRGECPTCGYAELTDEERDALLTKIRADLDRRMVAAEESYHGNPRAELQHGQGHFGRPLCAAAFDEEGDE